MAAPGKSPFAGLFHTYKSDEAARAAEDALIADLDRQGLRLWADPAFATAADRATATGAATAPCTAKAKAITAATQRFFMLNMATRGRSTGLS